MSDSSQVAFLDNENENRAALALSRLDAIDCRRVSHIKAFHQESMHDKYYFGV